jgi:hypothetical protein
MSRQQDLVGSLGPCRPQLRLDCGRSKSQITPRGHSRDFSLFASPRGVELGCLTSHQDILGRQHHDAIREKVLLEKSQEQSASTRVFQRNNGIAREGQKRAARRNVQPPQDCPCPSHSRQIQNHRTISPQVPCNLASIDRRCLVSRLASRRIIAAILRH